MRKTGLFVAIMTLAALPALARQADSTQTWTRSVTGTASGTQAGFQNWAEGGVNTFAVSFGLDGTAGKVSGAWTQKHGLRLTYGVVKQGDIDTRKAEDLIRLRSAVQYAGEGFFAILNPTAAASFRTQFAPGYDYGAGAGGTDVKVSEFLAPATLTQTLGLTYDPTPWFKQRVGFAAKETVVTLDELKARYKVDPDKTLRWEAGMEAFTEVDRELATNVRYKSSLGLFMAFNQADKPDVIWENAISMKVNSWLGVNFEWTFLLDKDVKADLQSKEVLSVGITYIFI